MPEAARRSPELTASAGTPELTREIEAALLTPLYTRHISLLSGHVAWIGLCAVAAIRLAAPWPDAFVVASFVMLLARLAVLALVSRARGGSREAAFLRWRRMYQAVGIAWSLLAGAFGALCIAIGDDEFTRLLAIIVALGTTGGIASRNAGTPRFALVQICLWLLPLLVAAPLLGSWYWAVSFLIAIYTAALCSIVRQHYTDLLSLIAAVTESRQAQVALTERDAELQAIFDNAAAGFAEVEFPSRRFLRVNDQLCRMVGWSQADILGRLILPDLSHPDEHAGEAERLAEICETGKAYGIEKRYIRRDGSVFWARASASIAAWGADGRPRRLVVFMQDITEGMEAAAALRTSQEVLRLSLDIARIGDFSRDYVNDVLYCSPQTRIMHGLPPGDGPIPVVVWASMIPPEDQADLARKSRAAFAQRQPITAFEYRFRHPVDGIRHIETRSRIGYDGEGRPVSALGVVIDITERRQAEARIAHLAHHDPLTDLPNRTLFRIRLDEALARAGRGERFAVFCLDLDHFKDVNDTLGHPVGDALLKAVTARLSDELRELDTVARLGGDEFAVIQSGIERADDATALAERLIAALGAPFDIEGQHILIGVSIGVAMVPDDGLDPDELLRNADLALYRAKADGRSLHRFFEFEMDRNMQLRRALELDLRQALDLGEFELFYQPIVSLSPRTLRGFEALLRWRHPTRGLVSPDRFVPMAEAIGLIVPIGAWVLREACGEAATWPASLRVAVNLSAVQFTGHALVDTVTEALRQSGLDPRRLELEVTETALLHDTEVTLGILHRLKEIGVGIAMDDFGTGYSSLSYLQRFPFDKVKIDRSFVANLGITRESAVIVGAVIDLCAGLDMGTTVEGIETEEQLAALIRIGRAEAQGFYFSRPVPVADIAGLIARFGDPAACMSREPAGADRFAAGEAIVLGADPP